MNFNFTLNLEDQYVLYYTKKINVYPQIKMGEFFDPTGFASL
jgi:hypothetical protein